MCMTVSQLYDSTCRLYVTYHGVSFTRQRDLQSSNAFIFLLDSFFLKFSEYTCPNSKFRCFCLRICKRFNVTTNLVGMLAQILICIRVFRFLQIAILFCFVVVFLSDASGRSGFLRIRLRRKL